MTDIGQIVDADGWGVLTSVSMSLFIAAGCEPACHICYKELKIGVKFHLKPFFTRKRGKREIVAQVMLGRKCSKDDATLSFSKAFGKSVILSS